MKIKKHFNIISIIFIAALFVLVFSWLFANNFSEKKALTMLFGDYDSTHKNSIWRGMRFPNNDIPSFWESKVGIVSGVLFQRYKECGRNKVFFLTKTIPVGISFGCHACLPLLGAAVFVRKYGVWQVESQNKFLMYEGEYGVSPVAKLITIGESKFGLLLELEHRNGESLAKEVTLLVPYRDNIEIAHQEIIYYDNFNSCGWSMPCAFFTAKLDFEESGQDPFYALIIKRIGTENDEAQAYKAIPVSEKIFYHFVNGRYIKISNKGLPRIRYAS